MGAIDSLRAPTRNLHETWRSDLTKTAGQLMAEESIDRKEAQIRVLWARRQQKRMDEMDAFIEEIEARRAARGLSGGFEAPLPPDTRRRVSQIEEDGTEGSR